MLDEEIEWVVYRVRGRVNATPKSRFYLWKRLTGNDLSVYVLAEGLTHQQAVQMVKLAMESTK